jgi:hypothetical protein
VWKEPNKEILKAGLHVKEEKRNQRRRHDEPEQRSQISNRQN